MRVRFSRCEGGWGQIYSPGTGTSLQVMYERVDVMGVMGVMGADGVS